MPHKPLILVTGGTGYIGSHTVVALIREGYQVLIADNLSNSNTDTLDRIQAITGVRPEFCKTELTHEHEVKELFNSYPQIQAVIHFAALKAVGESMVQPFRYFRNNLDSMLLVLEQMQKTGIGHFVFSSSATVYGQPKDLPVDESAPFLPAESPYGRTKQIGEWILQDACRLNGLNACSLRYFNPMGAHDSGLLGELPQGVPNNLLPYLTQTAAGERQQLTVFGKDYPTPDGTCVRDYIHVMDLASAHVMACQALISGKIRGLEVMNLGTGKGSSVLEVIRAFEQENKLKLNWSFGPRRPGDVTEVWANAHKAKEVLGWEAEYNLNDMVRTAWSWEKNLRALKNSQL